MHLQYPLEDDRIKFKKISVYKTKDKYILIGNNPLIPEFHIIYIHVMKGSELNKISLASILHEDEKVFQTCEQAKNYLISRFNRELNYQYECTGIIGFIKFLQGYYMILIKDTIPTAKLGKHKIFSIKTTQWVELFEQSQKFSNEEERYKKMMQKYDLEICFYGSYTYDLTQTLSKNLLNYREPKISVDNEGQIPFFNNDFLWNKYVLKEFEEKVKNKRWILPIIHGYCEQVTIKTYGNMFSICLIGRRSIHHAGARYLTRGINEKGKVANFVETEQIVIELDRSSPQCPSCSSFVQIRGSAPVYWYQEPNLLIPKPPIIIHNSDPYLMATKSHISDLIRSYGKQIYMVNLVKSNERNPREQILAEEFQLTINTIKDEIIQNPSEIEIGYLHFDMKQQLKSDKDEFVSKCNSLAYYCILKTGVFLMVRDTRDSSNTIIEIQNGIVRSNCVDCLDRTNAFQQLIGEMALKIQMAKINQTTLKFDLLWLNEQIFVEFREMYNQLGDFISLQYGSSVAHQQKINSGSKKRFELMTSLKRHLNNNMQDQFKQNQIDIFLGMHVPDQEEPFIWEQTSYVTLFPNNDYLKKHVEFNDWWIQPYQDFLKNSYAEQLSQLCRERSNQQLSQVIIKRPLKKMNTFNFDIIERMTQKSSNNKIKNQYCFRFLITNPPIQFRKKDYIRLGSLETKLQKDYNDIQFFDRSNNKDQDKEDQQDENNQRNQSFELTPTKVCEPIDRTELDFYIEYIQPKSFEELSARANEIRFYLKLELTEQDETRLLKDLEEYVTQKPIKDSAPKVDVEEKKSIYQQDNLKSSIAQSDLPNQITGSIAVHQPKKITVEQKTMKFLESLLKKNSTQSQRLKINKI